MAIKEFYDPTLFSDPKTAMDLYGNALRKTLEFNSFGTKRVFSAIVLTRPIFLADADITAAGGGGSPFRPRKDMGRLTKFAFKGRILDHPSPHDYLPDPCNPEITANTATTMRVINMHTTFISSDDYTKSDNYLPRLGDIVRVELTDNIFSYNLQFGTFLAIRDNKASSTLDPTNREDCTTLREAFGGEYLLSTVGGNPNDPGTFSWSNHKKQLTRTWKPTGLVMKNGEIENSGLLVTVPCIAGAVIVKEALEDLCKLAAAFKAKFKKPLKSLQGYRTYSGQVKQRLKRVPGDKCKHCMCGKGKNKKLCPTKPHGGNCGDGSGSGQYNAACKYIGYAATPGRSNHGWGASIDLDRDDWANKGDTAPEFMWLNKFGKQYNFIFGAPGERWHIDWTKYKDLTDPPVILKQAPDGWNPPPPIGSAGGDYSKVVHDYVAGQPGDPVKK